MQERPPRLSADQLTQISKEELATQWLSLQSYVDSLEARTSELEADAKKLRESDRLKSLEILKLKNAVIMKYSIKETTPSPTAQTNGVEATSKMAAMATSKMAVTLDPCASAVVEQLQRELEETRKARDDLQNELQGWKFSPESHMGKRLILKCRKLLQENEELGKLISSDNLAKLEADLAYHKALLTEACENEQNLNSFVSEMDMEMDAMQTTIVQLQEVIRSKMAANGGGDNKTEEPSASMTTS